MTPPKNNGLAYNRMFESKWMSIERKYLFGQSAELMNSKYIVFPSGDI